MKISYQIPFTQNGCRSHFRSTQPNEIFKRFVSEDFQQLVIKISTQQTFYVGLSENYNP